MDIFQSLLFGIVEGFTEFLPVSSTGHLILLSQLLGIPQDDFHKAYEVIIQLGSILAVVFLYREKLFSDWKLWSKLIAGFIPTGILGLLLYSHVKSLFDAGTVVTMLILGGLIFILLERWYKPETHRINEVEKIGYKEAVAIGFFQSLAMIPGTSRSGASIIGGLLLGLNRKSAAEFSFLLAVPTMFAASGYDVYKNYEHFSFDNTLVLAVGFACSFFFAIIAIKTFLALISRYSFVPFGIYRIIVGLAFWLFVL